MNIKNIRYVGTITLIMLALGGCQKENTAPVADSGDQAEKLPAYSAVMSNGTEDEAGQSEEGIAEPFDFKSDKNPTSEQLKLASQKYSFWTMSGQYTTLNDFGQFVDTKDAEVTEIKDVLTGETRFYEASYKAYEKTGEWEYDVTYTSKVYDVNGEPMTEWTDVRYQSCIGEWICTAVSDEMLYTDMESIQKQSLLHIRTGEEIEGIYSIEKINDTKALVITSDARQSFVMDNEGNKLFDFAKESDTLHADDMLYVYHGYILRVNQLGEELQISVYTPEGKKLGRIKDVADVMMYADTIVAPYMLCDNKIYDPKNETEDELVPVYKMEGIEYYDGECAICFVLSTSGIGEYYIYDADTNEAIAGPYEKLYPEDAVGSTKERTPAAFFIGVQDGSIEKIDRDGTVLAQTEHGDVGDVTVYDTAIKVTNKDYTKECLLNLDLQKLISEETYVYMYPLFEEATYATTGLWVGEYYLGKNQQNVRRELFKPNGEVLMSGISFIGTLTDGKIPVVRGQSLGLIDTNGDWLLKIPKHEATYED